MGNIQRGEISIDLDRGRILKFNSYARAVFQQDYGDTWDDCKMRMLKAMLRIGIFKKENAEPQLRKVLESAELWPGEFKQDIDLPLMLKACLLHEDKTLTLERACALMDMAPGNSSVERYGYVMGKLFEAMKAAEPKLSPEQEEALKKTLQSVTAEPTAALPPNGLTPTGPA